MRFLVLGCGSIGKRHIRNLRALGEADVHAFDPAQARRQEALEAGASEAFADLGEALGKKPSAVLVCSPTSLHLEQSLAAARAGAHLFIEKPLSTTLDGLDELLAETAVRNLSSLVGCNFRFHPGMVRVKELLTGGELGRIVSARADFGQYLPDWHPWEDYRRTYSARRDLGGGVLFDRIHEIDLLLWLMGDVSAVSAFMGTLSGLEIDTEDTVDMILRFAGGAQGAIHLDYLRRDYKCVLEVTGELGVAEWSFLDHRIRWYTARDKAWSSLSWPRHDVNQMYLEQTRHFLRVLRGEEESQNDLAGGIAALRVALAAISSDAQGRVVKP